MKLNACDYHKSVMTVVQMAIQAKANYKALRDAVIAHPTMAEGLNVLFSTVKQLS